MRRRNRSKGKLINPTSKCNDSFFATTNGAAAAAGRVGVVHLTRHSTGCWSWNYGPREQQPSYRESTNQGQNNPGSVRLTIGSPSINLPVFDSRAFIIRTGARGDMSYHPLGRGLLHGFFIHRQEVFAVASQTSECLGYVG